MEGQMERIVTHNVDVGNIEVQAPAGYHFSEGALQLLKRIVQHIATAESGLAPTGFSLTPVWLPDQSATLPGPDGWEFKEWCDDSMAYDATWKSRTFDEMAAKVNDPENRGEFYDGNDLDPIQF